MKQENSAGAVIFFENGNNNLLYLILQYGMGHWGLAKGNIEKNETLDQTALREIQEETNLTITLEKGFEHGYEYFYKDKNGELIHKKVTFFVARASSREVTLSYEHLAYKWLPLTEALKQTTFANTRQLLQLADQWIHTYLKKH
ncbi:MAG: NUDIX domain-containing protein [Candidatus Babeliaceae bacterium]